MKVLAAIEEIPELTDMETINDINKYVVCKHFHKLPSEIDRESAYDMDLMLFIAAEMNKSKQK